MLSRRLTLLVLVGALSAASQRNLGAHAGPRLFNPLEGATLGDSPQLVRLYFSEQPEPSLSTIRVLDTGGRTYQTGRPVSVEGDPLSLAVGVRTLPTGVYVVNWRIVSAVDGHVTAGAYAFGVRMMPALALAQTASAAASRFEIVARFIFIVGLVMLLGFTTGGLVRFAGTSGLALGVWGWLLAMLGLVLLAAAQRNSAAAPWAALVTTPVGRALIWRALMLGAAGVALLCVRLAPVRFRRTAVLLVALAALASIAIHVSNGHAAAGGRWTPAVTVAVQWVHFAAVGVWVGGLTMLLLTARGTPSASTSAAVREFSAIAAVGLFLVAATGTLLTAGVVSSLSKTWTELTTTDYGRTVLAKIALIGAIAACAAFNRFRSVPAAPTDLRPLRRAGRLELTFMAAALVAASTLGTLPPPAGGAPPGLDVSGTDFGTTVRVHLTTPSDQPGPNRFIVEALDYDSKTPIHAIRVTLRFTPLDDPGVASTALRLALQSDDTYIGSGTNLAFEGRWRVTTLIELARSSVEVSLDLETRTTPQRVSIQRNPGQDPLYDVEVGRSSGQIRISPHPEHPGLSSVYVTAFDAIGDIRPLDEIIVTAAGPRAPDRQQVVRRLPGDKFVADIELTTGVNRITVVARTPDGTRLRATATIDVPNR